MWGLRWAGRRAAAAEEGSALIMSRDADRLADAVVEQMLLDQLTESIVKRGVGIFKTSDQVRAAIRAENLSERVRKAVHAGLRETRAE